MPPGNVEIVPPLDADVQAARKAQPPEEEKDGTPLALRLHLGAGADKEAKAAEVSAAVQAPAFADALMGKLKAAPGGGFAALSAVAAGPSKVAAMAGGVTVGATAEGGVVGVGGGGGAQEAAPVEDARDLSVFLWDIVGGGAALFAVLMLLVHFRWAHWQRLAVAQQQEGGGAAHAGQQGPTAAGTAAAAAAASSAAILGRIRQGTESIGSVSGLKRGTGSSSNVKPDTRSYELVEAGKGGGAHLVGGEDEAEEEDIEMI